MSTSRLPYTADDWKSIQEIAARTMAADSYESLILNIIFGQEYLKQTVDLLAEHPELLEPIEKFLRAVSSPFIREYLLELCFVQHDPRKRSTACILLPALAEPDLWDHLPAFAAATELEVVRCGIAICGNLADNATSAELTEALNLFRFVNDEYIANKVKDLDAVVIELRKYEAANP